MSEDTKKDIRRALDLAERGITRSVIRWKCRKEGRPVPSDDTLEGQSKQVVEEAHKIIARRSKNMWNELKSIYAKQKGKTGEDKG